MKNHRTSGRKWRRVGVLAAIGPLLLAGRASAEDVAGKIDALLSRYHHIGEFNGAALVADGGKVVLKKGYGLAQMEWQVPNAPDTRFRLGSITKQFTAALVLQQVDKGTLRLEGVITDYLPDYRKDVGAKVTLHHLLTHTSGIPSYTSGPALAELSRDPQVVAEFVNKHCSGDLQFEPGTRFAYNNSGYFLLGAILEKVTRKSYEQLLQESVLDPLGMKDTGYDHHETILARRAAGYEKSLMGGYRNADYLDMSVPYAAGSLYSTVEDLFRWEQSLYGDRVLSARARERMFQPFLDDYAYGWGVTRVAASEADAGAMLIGHGGGINGFSTLLQRAVDRRAVVILLNNTGPAPLARMATGVRALLAGREPAAVRAGIAAVVASVVRDQGTAAAVERYRALKASDPGAYDFEEGQLNRLGYELLGQGRVADAIIIFKLNVEAFPDAFNTYDSLGEAYLKAGDKVRAAESYRRSLALNKDNTNAAEALKKLP